MRFDTLTDLRMSGKTVALSPVAFGDGTRIHPASLSHGIPFPPASLMWSIGAPSLDSFLAIANAWNHLANRFLSEEACVLDAGCGCGRVARPLVQNPRVRRYIGFDVIRENVAWCREYIAPPAKARAAFYWFDVHSGQYNPQGRLRAEELVFPCEREGCDLVIASSVFTHLLEPAARHYLAEIRRVLSPRGCALCSILPEPAPGSRFSGDELRIDIDPDYFLLLAESAGLLERERLPLEGQLVFVLAASGERKPVEEPAWHPEARLTEELAALARESAALVDSLETRLSGALTEIARLVHLQNALEQSRSWRMTQPVRAAMHWLRTKLLRKASS